VWHASYLEEKQGLLDANTYEIINVDQYRTMRRAGAPQAIPTMCVLVVKPDEHEDPDRAKSRIVVLGNQECRVWHKHERAAPVIRQSSVRLLVSSAVSAKRKVQQGDAQNAFCNPDLPLEETTIVCPPLGDPAAKEGDVKLFMGYASHLNTGLT
jgi:hypothetical protein